MHLCNKFAQSNLGRGPRRGAVAHVRRKVPIGYNGAPQIRPQNYHFPRTDPQIALPPASSLDPSDLWCQTASGSNPLFFHNALDGPTDRQIVRERHGLIVVRGKICSFLFSRWLCQSHNTLRQWNTTDQECVSNSTQHINLSKWSMCNISGAVSDKAFLSMIAMFDTLCAADINECIRPDGASPCLNNATCVNNVNRFKCVCPQLNDSDTFVVGLRCENCTSHIIHWATSLAGSVFRSVFSLSPKFGLSPNQKNRLHVLA